MSRRGVVGISRWGISIHSCPRRGGVLPRAQRCVCSHGWDHVCIPWAVVCGRSVWGTQGMPWVGGWRRLQTPHCAHPAPQSLGSELGDQGTHGEHLGMFLRSWMFMENACLFDPNIQGEVDTVC